MMSNRAGGAVGARRAVPAKKALKYVTVFMKERDSVIEKNLLLPISAEPTST